jgi:hypothetical protein
MNERIQVGEATKMYEKTDSQTKVLEEIASHLRVIRGMPKVSDLTKEEQREALQIKLEGMSLEAVERELVGPAIFDDPTALANFYSHHLAQRHMKETSKGKVIGI